MTPLKFTKRPKVIFARVVLGVFAASLSSAQASAQEKAPNSPEVAIVKGDSGSCTADFVVRDGSGKGIYNAKITLHVEHGFLGVRKLDLSVTTNSDGKARVEGLPEKPRKPTEFKISSGDQAKTVPYDPFAHCNARHEITF